jgi:hypothetical protein
MDHRAFHDLWDLRSSLQAPSPEVTLSEVHRFASRGDNTLTNVVRQSKRESYRTYSCAAPGIIDILYKVLPERRIALRREWHERRCVAGTANSALPTSHASLIKPWPRMIQSRVSLQLEEA